VEGKQANKEIESAISAMIGMAGNAETSPLFRWAGHFGAIVLLLRKGEGDLHRVPEQIYKMENALGKALASYHHMKQKLPALFPDTANGPAGYDLQDVLHHLYTKADEQAAKNAAAAKATDFTTATNNFDKAVLDMIEEDHKYKVALQAHHTQEKTGGADVTDTRLHSVMAAISSFQQATQKLTQANKAIVEADKARHLASIRPEELKAAVEARQFFEDWAEQMQVDGQGIPDIVENHHSVVRYFQAVKSQFFYSVVAMMLKKQMDTLPLDKVEVLLEKGLGALQAAKQQPWASVVKELLTLKQPLVMAAEVITIDPTPLINTPVVNLKEAYFEEFKTKISSLITQINNERPQKQLVYDKLVQQYKQLEKRYLEETQPYDAYCYEGPEPDYIGRRNRYESPNTHRLLENTTQARNNYEQFLKSEEILAHLSQTILERFGNYSWHPSFTEDISSFELRWKSYVFHANNISSEGHSTTSQRVTEMSEQLFPLLDKIQREELDNIVITTNSSNPIQQIEKHQLPSKESPVLTLLKNAAEHLQDAYLGLPADQAEALKNAKTLLNLNNLFGFSVNFSEAQQAKLQQLTQGNAQYQQGLQNLRRQYAQQLEHALAVALDREPPAKAGQLYEALIEAFNTQVRKDVHHLEVQKNEVLQGKESAKMLSAEEYQTLLYKQQLMAQIPTLQQLHALVSDDLLPFANLNLPN
jgi:hypothetical protein